MQDKVGDKKRLAFAKAFVKAEQTKGSFPVRPLMPPKPPDAGED